MATLTLVMGEVHHVKLRTTLFAQEALKLILTFARDVLVTLNPIMIKLNEWIFH